MLGTVAWGEKDGAGVSSGAAGMGLESVASKGADKGAPSPSLGLENKLSFNDAFMESRIKQQATSNRTFTRLSFSTFPQLVCQACRLARMNKIKRSHPLQHLLSTKSVRYRVENSKSCEKNWYPPSHKPLVTSHITHRGSQINPRSRRCDPKSWLLCQPNP